MKKNLLVLSLMALFAIITAFTSYGQTPAKPAAVSPFGDDGQFNHPPPGANYVSYTRNAGVYDALTDGADRLEATQYTDGGWGWPLNAPPTYGNIIGPIAMGLAQAYTYTQDAGHLAALSAAGGYLLTKTNNFSPSDGYLAAKLDEVFGVTTYTTHLNTNFYGPLAAGTYDRNGLGVLYNTMDYVNSIRISRANQGIPNLAAWDVGIGLVAAASCGVTGTELNHWIAGTKGEIEELDIMAYYDVVGLAGALYGLAFVGEEFDPAAGPHAAASNLSDLADILASYQISLGGFAWNSQYVIANYDNENIQETAYAILALNEVSRLDYIENIYGAADYMISVQLTTGGWENYPSNGEYNEITAEALWGLAAAYLQVHNVTKDLFYAAIQDAINGAVSGDVIEVAVGIFTEQLHITTNNLTINGAGKANTIVKSPDILNVLFGTTSKPVVCIDGVTNCTITDLTVDGDGNGNANNRFMGISFWNAGGTIENVNILNITDTPFSGAQHGIGLYSYNDTGGPYTINCADMLIEGYQKNATALSGNGLTVNLENITTIGAGPTAVNGQNGIQVGFGAGGAIVNCNVSGNIYTGSGWSSAGILLYQGATVNVINTNVTDNYVGIDYNDNSGSFVGGTIANNHPDSWDGIYVRKYSDAKGPVGENEKPLASPFTEDYTFDPGSRAATTFTLTNGKILGSDKEYSWGLYIRSSAGTINATVNKTKITGWYYGIYVREAGGTVQSQVNNCDLGGNVFGFKVYEPPIRDITTQDATDNWWGDESGPYDPVSNPLGQGSEVSDNVDYADWITDPVDIRIDNPECGMLYVIASPSMPLDGSVTNILFAVKWLEADYPESFFGLNSSDYNVSYQYEVVDGSYKYAVFGTDLTYIDWEALVGDTILTLELLQNQSEGSITDFEIAADAYTTSTNADYYFEFWGSDLTGDITGSADDVYLGSCDLELHLKVLLQGPYNTTTNLMKQDLRTTGFIPLAHPFGGAPWNHTGTESLTAIPTGMIDWVLVELRETATGTAFTRQAALLFEDGSVRSHIDSFFDIFFTVEFMPNSDFYVVIYTRNHMPVMSGVAVNIPNAGDVHDFSNMVTYPSYGGATAQVLLEAGVHGMIAGDVNNDGDLIYSGPGNDRALILQRVTQTTPYINNVIQGYYPEDLTMDSWVKYSGSGNDQRLIILNLIELTGLYNLNVTYASLIPNWGAKSLHFSPGTGPLDIALVDNHGAIEIRLVSSENIAESWTDNIQFTLSWDETNTMMDQVAFNYSSDFLLEPQGEIRTENGRKYLTYAVVDWIAMPVPFNTGDRVTILTLEKGPWSGNASKTAIARDAFTASNNGSFYVSLIGQDMTGQVLDAVTGIGDPNMVSNTLKLYPNPVTQGYVNLSLMPAADETLIVTVTDLSARTITQQQFDVLKGQPVVKQVSLDGLASGIYFIRLQGPNTLQTGKIEILH